MSGTRNGGDANEAKVAVEQLRDGDLIDILPLLDDPEVYGWDWGAGYSTDMRQARLAAECEYAQVDGEAQQSGSRPGWVDLGTTQLNFTLPAGYLVTRCDD